MDSINTRELRQLVDVEQEPCVSIYLPTHRAGVDTLQNPIRFKNLVREVERLLVERGDRPRAVQDLLAPLRELVDQYEFWQHQADGLALFRSPDSLHRYRASFPVPELGVVARRFHLKPLLPAVEANRHFYILAVSQQEVKVYEANQHSMDEREIHGMPESPLVSPGERGPERQLQSHTASRRSSRRRVAVFHGHGAGEEDRKQALLSYFRRVDDAVERELENDQAPIVLAAVDYLCPIFRRASSNPNLLAGEVHGNPGGYAPGELHRLAWDIASTHFREDRNKAVDEYHQLWHTQRASKDLPAIMTAARQGRVKVLFVAVGVQEWGRVDPESAGLVHVKQLSAEDQDLLNLAAMETFISGGTVYAVPPGEVPGRGSVAAVFRY